MCYHGSIPFRGVVPQMWCRVLPVRDLLAGSTCARRAQPPNPVLWRGGWLTTIIIQKTKHRALDTSCHYRQGWALNPDSLGKKEE